MSAENPSSLRRRLSWSVATTLFLAFLTSTSTLSNEHRPGRTFTLGLEKAFPAAIAPTSVVPALDEAALARSARSEDSGVAIVAAPGTWRLRPSDDGRAIDDYVKALPFGKEIDDAARRNELDVLLLASIVEAESGFRSDAISPKGALGLMQLMPLHFEENAEPFDPAHNLDLGARYFGSLSDRYGGDLELTLAAYHAGPGTVARYGGAPPWKETRRYVDRVLTLYREHRENLAGNSAAL
jgi:soluble lytic murein transglycosylase-like protein